MSGGGLTAGFGDPVLGSQACFRAVLEAMARPGRVFGVGGVAEPPAPLSVSTAAVLLTLVDAETGVWLDPAVAAGAAAWVAFHCGAAVVARRDAAFAVGVGPVWLEGLRVGSDDAPEGGATLIWQVGALGSGRAYRLRGPGLAAPAVVRVDGLGDGFVAAWAANRAGFPRGVDVVLCAGDRVMAFPRTVEITDVTSGEG